MLISWHTILHISNNFFGSEKAFDFWFGIKKNKDSVLQCIISNKYTAFTFKKYAVQLATKINPFCLSCYLVSKLCDQRGFQVAAQKGWRVRKRTITPLFALLENLTKGGGHDNSVIMVKQHVGCRLLLMEIHFHEPACLTHQYQKVTMPGATTEAHET